MMPAKDVVRITCESIVRNLATKAATIKPLDAQKNGVYHYIPYDHTMFVEGLRKALELWKKAQKYPRAFCKFLDAGSGPGLTVLLARDVLWYHGEASGVELDSGLVKVASTIGAKVSQGNILAWDYRPYDIVYSYRPLENDRLWKRFCQRVATQLKVGSVIYCPYTQWDIGPRTLARFAMTKVNGFGDPYSDGLLYQKVA